jgi:EmrB/QacA subfamily drug resistance transporter
MTAHESQQLDTTLNLDTQLDTQLDIKHHDQDDHQNTNKWWTITGIGLGVFIFALDVYIVNLALPSMIESLHTSFAVIQWVVLSYLLAIAITVLSISKLGDMWSKKKLYLIGMIIFTLSSLVCGLSSTVEMLIIFRAIQGMGAAFLSGLGTAIIVEAFPPEQRGLSLGIRAGVYGLGITLGPTIGGMLLALGDWKLIFLINVPIGLIGIAIVARFVPPSVIRETSKSFDILGTLLLTLTLTCFTVGITLSQNNSLDASLVGYLFALAIAGFISFLIVETSQEQPMLDLNIFRSREFSIGLIFRFIGNLVMAGVIFILPFFLQLIKQYPTEKAGLLLAIPPVIISITAPISGTLADRFGGRLISFIGLCLIGMSCIFFSTFDADSSILNYVLAIAPYALGVGIFQSPNNSIIMGAAPAKQLGVASGLLSLSRILGQAVGVPIVGSIFSLVTITAAKLAFDVDVTAAPIDSLVAGMHTTFQAIAAFLFIATLFTTCFWWLDRFGTKQANQETTLKK